MQEEHRILRRLIRPNSTNSEIRPGHYVPIHNLDVTLEVRNGWVTAVSAHSADEIASTQRRQTYADWLAEAAHPLPHDLPAAADPPAEAEEEVERFLRSRGQGPTREILVQWKDSWETEKSLQPPPAGPAPTDVHAAARAAAVDRTLQARGQGADREIRVRWRPSWELATGRHLPISMTADMTAPRATPASLMTTTTKYRKRSCGWVHTEPESDGTVTWTQQNDGCKKHWDPCSADG